MTQTLSQPAEALTEAPSGLEFRSAELASVDFPKRLVELIVMPYETETTIATATSSFREIVTRGAFNGIQARNDKVRVNRDHDVTRTVGRAVAFHPSRQDGLVAEIRISMTDLGEETLVLAEDGVLDASAGFRLLRDKNDRVVPNAEVWETQARRRLNHLYLGHIALTPEPAYETAQVLAVRQKESVPEPVRGLSNRERMELERFQAEYDAINARYSHH